jgi:hypothetical protein
LKPRSQGRCSELSAMTSACDARFCTGARARELPRAMRIRAQEHSVDPYYLFPASSAGALLHKSLNAFLIPSRAIYRGGRQTQRTKTPRAANPLKCVASPTIRPSPPASPARSLLVRPLSCLSLPPHSGLIRLVPGMPSFLAIERIGI